jgi:hypothetical protein
LIVSLLTLGGCTHLQLQRNTIDQGSTLSDIQYQQVLDNLALFSCDPYALAWHVKVTGGLVQVADQGSGGLLPSGVRKPLVAPTLSLARNVVGQWNVDTVIESDDLELLQLAYQKAVFPDDPGREIKKEIVEKICELCGAFHIVLARDVAMEIIATAKLGASNERLEKLKQIELRLNDLYRRVDELAQQNGDTPLPAGDGPGHAGHDADIRAAKRQIVELLAGISKQSYLPGGAGEKPSRGPTTIEQAEDKVQALVDLVTESPDELNQFSTPWLHHGCKHDVPECACYVGHYRGCQGECYVWVTPERAKTLRDFILIVLNLVPPDAQEMTLPKLGVGAANSPNF